MSDVSLSDLGTSSNPLPGLDASDYQGYGSGSNSTSPDFSGMGSAAALGVGVLGFGSLLGQGEGPLPPQFAQLQAGVPWLQNTGYSVTGQGQTLVDKGTQTLDNASKGILTPEQQAQLKQYSSGLENQARQTYASMGRNPNQDTSFISTQGNINTQINAMAQSQIQSSITLGLGEVSGGNSLISSGLGFESAANTALIAAGDAQIKKDTAYSASLTSAFTSIGTLFAKAAMV